MPWKWVIIFAACVPGCLSWGWTAYNDPTAFNGYITGFITSTMLHSWLIIKEHL